MVIQRIQTLFMLLAIGMLVAFMFVPYGYYDVIVDNVSQSLSLKGTMEEGLWEPAVVACVLLLTAIFMYKRLPLQKMMVLLSILITGTVILTVIYTLVSGYSDETVTAVGGKTIWGGGGLLAVAALVAEIMALRGINSDQRLLNSYDKLR